MKAPRSGFSGPSTVTTIVRRALDRAGLHPAFKGAHVMRHYATFRTMPPHNAAAAICRASGSVDGA
jgi:hypothetical protein